MPACTTCPGGTPEPSELLADALAREVREETGYILGAARQVAVHDGIVPWKHDGASYIHHVAILYRGIVAAAGACGFFWVPRGG
jgi:ADP-ribose pyrophosphatase YjhB (NUDIX family)